jgi:hypothetical protein
MFDDALLEALIATFYGYGDYRGRYWFVGMEEGGGRDFAEIAARLASWDRYGRQELGSLGHWGDGPPHPFFREHPRLQRTWAALIRLTLSLQGAPVTTEAVRAYQRDRLGRADEDTCLLELLPLPARSTRDWLYRTHSTIPALQTRAGYLTHYAPARAAHLRARVTEYHPEVVIFYSVNGWYRQWWEQIAGVPLPLTPLAGWQFALARSGPTVCAVVAHPATRGITHAYFAAAAQAIARYRDTEQGQGSAAL